MAKVAIVVLVLVAALAAVANAAIRRTNYYALADTTCSGTLYVASTETVGSCTPVGCYATAIDRRVVTCPSNYDLTIPLTVGTYGVGYLYNSTSGTTCNATDIIGSGMSLVSINLCSAFGDGYTKTTCGATPLTLYCSDDLCQSCVSYPADNTCQGVPNSNLTSVNFCSDAASVRASTIISSVVAVLAVVIATVVATAF